MDMFNSIYDKINTNILGGINININKENCIGILYDRFEDIKKIENDIVIFKQIKNQSILKEKKCKICNNIFVPLKSNSKNCGCCFYLMKCEECGKFYITKQITISKNHFCSRTCRNKNSWTNMSKEEQENKIKILHRRKQYPSFKFIVNRM